MDLRLGELARRSPDFGFLLEHDPVLVGYGAAAEAMVFTDPNISMFKAPQFGEQLVATFGCSPWKRALSTGTARSRPSRIGGPIWRRTGT